MVNILDKGSIIPSCNDFPKVEIAALYTEHHKEKREHFIHIHYAGRKNRVKYFSSKRSGDGALCLINRSGAQC